MVVTMLPKWYGEAEEILQDAINKIATKNNLKYTFVYDSKSIENGKNTILNALVNISWNAPGEFTEEQLKGFKEIETAIKKDEKNKLRRKK